jgi:hypothetical protein
LYFLKTIFSSQIKNPEMIEMERLNKVLIGFSGTRIRGKWGIGDQET